MNVASSDSDAVKKALDIIKGLTTEPEVGAVYKGTVQRIADFGAFIEILPGTDGLLHVSEMAHTRVEKVTDVMKEGDTVEVKVLSVDRDGKIRLTRRELLPFPEGPEGEAAKKRLAQAREAGGPPRAWAVATVATDRAAIAAIAPAGVGRVNHTARSEGRSASLGRTRAEQDVSCAARAEREPRRRRRSGGR